MSRSTRRGLEEKTPIIVRREKQRPVHGVVHRLVEHSSGTLVEYYSSSTNGGLYMAKLAQVRVDRVALRVQKQLAAQGLTIEKPAAASPKKRRRVARGFQPAQARKK